MTAWDLFAGIGGFSLGLQRAGFTTTLFVEIEPYCQKVLQKNFPGVPIHDDIRTLNTSRYEQPDVITGGFPCQDISGAGKGKGIAGERSSLWFEMLRVISEIRPKYVIVENVSMLLSGERGNWFREFLNSLSSIGFNAEWETIYASQIGAPHPRKRIWIIAYPCEIRRNNGILDNFKYAVPAYKEWNIPQNLQPGFRWKHWLAEVCQASDGFISESDFCRVDDGLREELDRIAALGNSIVPQIAELIGRAIIEYETQ